MPLIDWTGQQLLSVLDSATEFHWILHLNVTFSKLFIHKVTTVPVFHTGRTPNFCFPAPVSAMRVVPCPEGYSTETYIQNFLYYTTFYNILCWNSNIKIQIYIKFPLQLLSYHGSDREKKGRVSSRVVGFWEGHCDVCQPSAMNDDIVYWPNPSKQWAERVIIMP